MGSLAAPAWTYELCHARRKSSREMEALEHMVLSVDLLRRSWLGIVNGVLLPSALSRIRAMCSRSRTRRKPSFSSDLITLSLGASAGNLTTYKLTTVSATNTSRTGESRAAASVPNVSRWSLIADLTSARASS